MTTNRSLMFFAISLFTAGCGSSATDTKGDGGGGSGSSGTSHGSTGASNSEGSGGGTTSAGNPEGGGSASGGGGTTGSGTLAAVDLGHAGAFAILAKSAISTVPTSAIVGDIAVSPAAASYITGFSLVADATNVFATSPQVTGKIYAANYAAPTPSDLTTAIGDMETAFRDAAGRAPTVNELGAGNIGGMTLAPGVYKWSTGLLVPVDVTLSGNANDVWIFQIAQKLVVSNAARVSLIGGAVAKNVFWQVAGLVDVGTTAHVEGIILTKTAITVRTGASVEGRLFAQTNVSIDSDSIVEPAP